MQITAFIFLHLSCGNDTVHQDAGDTFFYNCTRDSIEESFSIQSFRYFGVDAGQSVFIHCELKVCLDNTPNSECECPSVEECDPNARKRRSVSKIVVHRVKTGPYYFADEEEKLDDEGIFSRVHFRQKFLIFSTVESDVIWDSQPLTCCSKALKLNTELTIGKVVFYFCGFKVFRRTD